MTGTAPPTLDEATLRSLAQIMNENLVGTIESKIKAAVDPITAILDGIAAEPATKNAGYVTQDGGRADKSVRSFADFLMAIRRGDVERLTKHYGTKAALAEDGGTTGGYLVPTEFVGKLLEVMAESAIVRPRAYIQPMATRDLLIPALDQETAPSAGNTAFYGGVVMNWTGEGGAYTETEPTFRMIQLVAHKLGGYALTSNEVMADNGIALEALLTRLFGGAIAWYEDYAFLRGDGSGKPLGVFNAAATLSTTRNTSSHIKLADTGNMLSKLLPSSYKNALWIAHPSVIPDLIQLALSNATVVSWIGNMRDGIPATLLGLPIVFSEKVVALGTLGDLNLFDLSYYVIGDRNEFSIAMSEHFKFTNAQTTWRVDNRVDGQPWVKSSITLADASSTVSPFVQVAT